MAAPSCSAGRRAGPVCFSLVVAPGRGAPRRSRSAVRERLTGVLPASRLADLTLMVSELVSNAVLHGGGEIELRIDADERYVRGQVIDGGGGFLRPPPGRPGVGGLGLVVIERLAETWGIRSGPTNVWFELAVLAPDHV